MPLKTDETGRLFLQAEKAAVMALIVAQVLVTAYLMVLDISNTLLLVLLLGLPVALCCNYLLGKSLTYGYVRMSVVMFAAGGLGMLIGCSMDLNQTGLYAYVSLCQSEGFSFAERGASLLWQKLQLLPWTYLGMLIGGNLGMSLLKGKRCNRPLTRGRLIFLYLLCNAGMLLGMVLAEALASGFIANLGQPLAAGLMVISMLVGMTLGMVLLMAIFNRFNRFHRQPSAFMSTANDKGVKGNQDPMGRYL
jgi:hypothetical protein